MTGPEKSPPVKIYSLSTCKYCRAAKKFLDDSKVRYECVEVNLLKGAEQKEALREVRRLNPKRTFPTVVIGDKVVAGFEEAEIKEALGGL